MELNNFQEYNYIRGDWFNQFPLGPDNPGERNWIDEAEKRLGGNTEDVLYYFNEWRYRGKITPGSSPTASFGCSHAMGYGVQTPYAEILGMVNLGWSGFSNDAIVRLAYTYCEAFNPESIVVLWTIPHRREYVNAGGYMRKYRAQKDPKPWQQNFTDLQNDKWDEYNYTKNKLFLENYCTAKSIRLIQFDFSDNDYKARDGIHPGPDWHVSMAAQINDQL